MKNHLFKLSIDTVFSDKISDHKFIIYNNILFWNIMMQGKMRAGSRGNYNNGFGIVESEQEYVQRLKKIGRLIAELVLRNPNLIAIGLCEGPIQDLHIQALINTLKNFSWMRRFFSHDAVFHKPVDSTAHKTPNWGLMLFADKEYKVKPTVNLWQNDPKYQKLINRWQVWEFEKSGETKYIGLTHLPFGGDEKQTEINQLSAAGRDYSQLIAHHINLYSDKDFSIGGDYNINPFLFDKSKFRRSDKIPPHNSLLLENSQRSTLTVDGILLSQQAKQKFLGSTIPIFLSIFNPKQENENSHQFSRRAEL